MSKKQPPKDWEDSELFDDRCTCDEYDWPEQSCPYSEEINDDPEDYCNCCPFCTQNCFDNI